MLTAKRAGARLGYPTPLQQRAVPVQRDKATTNDRHRLAGKSAGLGYCINQISKNFRHFSDVDIQ
jgi:hypothetical protein